MSSIDSMSFSWADIGRLLIVAAMAGIIYAKVDNVEQVIKSDHQDFKEAAMRIQRLELEVSKIQLEIQLTNEKNFNFRDSIYK